MVTTTHHHVTIMNINLPFLTRDDLYPTSGPIVWIAIAIMNLFVLYLLYCFLVPKKRAKVIANLEKGVAIRPWLYQGPARSLIPASAGCFFMTLGGDITLFIRTPDPGNSDLPDPMSWIVLVVAGLVVLFVLLVLTTQSFNRPRFLILRRFRDL